MIAALALLAWAETTTLTAAAPKAYRAVPALGALDEGPVELSFLDGGLGAPRSGRPRSEVGLAVAGGLLAAPEDFYGHVSARGILTARWSIDDDFEVSLLMELVRWETVISSLSAGRIGFGTTGVGVTWRLAKGQGWDASLTTRASLPTDYGARAHALPFGLDLGAILSGRLHSTLEVHAVALGVGTVQISEGPAFPRFGMAGALGASWQPLAWLSATGDVGALLGYDDPVDRVTAALALRFRPSGGRWAVDLSVSAPVTGADRTLLVAGLGVRMAWP